MNTASIREDCLETSALAALFSARVVQELARRGRSLAFAELLRESGLAARTCSTDTVSSVFDTAFEALVRSPRSEYVFKAAIAEKILLGRHSLNTAVMLTEFRVGACKADVVILNGTSTAYEVKSDVDRLDRLASQVATYLEAFACVNVVASDRHVPEVLDQVPGCVGVVRLTRRGALSTVRPATEDTSRLCPTVLFDMLRLREAKAVVRTLGQRVPAVPNTRLHRALRDVFASIQPADLHPAVVQSLTKSRSHRDLGNLIRSVPRSLRAATLATRLRRSDRSRLVAALRTPMADAWAWG